MRKLARLVFRRQPAPEAPLPLIRPKVLVFDFDGTVADTFAAGVRILNQLAPEFGYRVLPEEEVPMARGMRTRELMKHLGISMTKMTRLARRGSEELTRCMPSVQPLPGVPEMLRTLKEKGYVLGLVTSNTQTNVSIFLKGHDLEVFEFIQCSSKLMGKAREFRAVMKQRKLSPAELITVGDEMRDIEAAHKAGIRIAAVTWGYNSQKALEVLKPHFVFHEPRELVAFLDQLPETAQS